MFGHCEWLILPATPYPFAHLSLMNATPPRPTVLIGVGFVIFGLILVRFWPRAGALIVVFGILVFFCEGAGAEFAQLLKDARGEWAVVGRQRRVLLYLLRRRVRAVTRPSATMALAWQAFVVLILLALFSPAAGVDGDGQKVAIDTLTTLGVVIGLTDLFFMGVRAMRWSWARSAGKGFRGLFATLVTALAIALARPIVFDLASEDPSKFPGTLGVIGLLCLPFAWAAVVAVVAALAVAPAMVWTLIRATRDAGSSVAKIARGLRLVLIGCAVVVTFNDVSPPQVGEYPSLRKVGVGILVSMDFWSQPVCGGERVLSARVGENRYLIAPTDKGSVALEPRQCPVPH